MHRQIESPAVGGRTRTPYKRHPMAAAYRGCILLGVKPSERGAPFALGDDLLEDLIQEGSLEAELRIFQLAADHFVGGSKTAARLLTQARKGSSDAQLELVDRLARSLSEELGAA